MVNLFTYFQGRIYSIQNKQILLEFNLPGTGEKALAKLIPGTFMFEKIIQTLDTDPRQGG